MLLLLIHARLDGRVAALLAGSIDAGWNQSLLIDVLAHLAGLGLADLAVRVLLDLEIRAD